VRSPETDRPSLARRTPLLAAATIYDAAALRVMERIRSSLDLEEVLQYTVDELGEVVGASRALVQLAPDERGYCLMVEWNRGDTLPLTVRPPTPTARKVLESREPLVIDRRSDVEDESIVRYMEDEGVYAAVSFPVSWQGNVLAVLGFHDDVPRDWRDGALPLLERVELQLAAALVQAELYRRQTTAVAEMERIARMREELVANVSHDLRTPLASIIGTIKTLRRTDAEIDARTFELLLATADDQAERLELLVEDILELNRMSHGSPALQVERLDARELIDTVLHQLAVPADRPVEVAVEGEVAIDGDRRRLVQLLTNLAENALRHGRGRIILAAAATSDAVEISVGDEGDGVPQWHEQDIFEPFSHASTRADSTGLGLSIARAVAEAHGGSLRYEPASTGRTHRFVLQLPAPARAAG
jgi:K+-sensing histidine kinase KdpD